MKRTHNNPNIIFFWHFIRTHQTKLVIGWTDIRNEAENYSKHTHIHIIYLVYGRWAVVIDRSFFLGGSLVASQSVEFISFVKQQTTTPKVYVLVFMWLKPKVNASIAEIPTENYFNFHDVKTYSS